MIHIKQFLKKCAGIFPEYFLSGKLLAILPRSRNQGVPGFEILLMQVIEFDDNRFKQGLAQ